MDGMGEFVSIEGGTGYEAVNDANAYNEDWQVSDPDMYIARVTPDGDGGGGVDDVSYSYIAPEEEGTGEGTVQSQSGSSRPLTRLPSRNGQVGVRTNIPLNFSGGGILVGGRASGTIPAGMPVYGTDRNRDGIPDLLEKCVQQKICSWSRP